MGLPAHLQRWHDELGYNPYVVLGRVSGTRDGAADGLTRHGWVMIDGAYYDPEARVCGLVSWCVW